MIVYILWGFGALLVFYYCLFLKSLINSDARVRSFVWELWEMPELDFFIIFLLSMLISHDVFGNVQET